MICMIPRNIIHHLKKSTSQHLQVSLKLFSTHDSSSSSDSSDSDEEIESKQKKQNLDAKFNKNVEKSVDGLSTHERLDSILQQLSQPKKKNELEKKIHVAIKPKQDRFKELKKKKSDLKVPYEKQLVQAAKDVAKSMKGDSQKTEKELLSKVLKVESANLNEKSFSSNENNEEPATPNLSNLLSSMRIDTTTSDSYAQRRQKMAIDSFNKQQQHKKLKRFDKEQSYSEALLQQKSKNLSTRKEPPVAELHNFHSSLGIFKKIAQQKDNTPELSTWNSMENREIKLTVLRAPDNAFQEQILWTNQGKLWRFPIDNEQGMENEEKIHFTEHVFLEKHLKDWCPQRGPIRHFMELVCTGLSKNPYMTVAEKIGHITWYRDYFEDKKNLLNELQILDKTSIDESKKQIEA